MSYSFVARQPILDRNKNTFAYELLFRDGSKNAFPHIDADQATGRVMLDQFFSTQCPAIGDKIGFINFPYNSLISLAPLLLPKEKIVVEILEDCLPTDELYTAIVRLKSDGYCIALDDFIPSPEWRRFLPHIDIIKFDIRVIPLKKAARFIEKLKGSKIQFLAEKVETHEEFQQALACNFDLFQGYFFSRPEIIKQKKIYPFLETVIELCKEISNKEINYKKLEAIFTSDVTLSFKLLRYVNSSQLLTPIRSFHQALAFLDEEKLRKFISLVTISSIAEDKSDILYTLSIQRARFCELTSQNNENDMGNNQAFLVGLLSLLDALFDAPIEDIVDILPVEPTVKEALLFNSGTLGRLLSLVKAYEKADWESVAQINTLLDFKEDFTRHCYDQSMRWSDGL
ncbi:EAL domain-containing protein [Vibrio sp. DW001]|uniref:EAL and HDOD domain-containing protein n=1 Tax=Vibrio sp. DW001 TaxID=2912315 RepID=UPI0023AF05C7|nr:EAL domain-containing protein [Vibrio sp. DW001]WED28999.1 EAL domain-containing protein [Vibrio sp. DW001]